ncbi:MAG: hypothetical protein ABJ081_07605 [Hyphomicrobiales bacterium]
MKNNKANSDHWLVRPASIRKIWIFGLILLVLTVLADFLIPHKSYFGIDGTFGFSIWFSLASCLVLVVVAKAFGALLKRSDSYYDR